MTVQPHNPEDQLPEFLGRQVAAETGYALVCNYTGKGSNPWEDAICGEPAKHHLRWSPENTENGFACEAHLEAAKEYQPHDLHGVEDSACGMPGAFWVDGPPSHCTLDALETEPERAGVRELVMQP